MRNLENSKSFKNKKNYLIKIIFITVFFLLLFGSIFLLNKKFNLSEKLKNLYFIALEKDALVKHIYLIDNQYDLFKKEISSQTKGEITFCDKFPETEKAIKAMNKDNIFGEYNRSDGLISFSTLGPQMAITSFSYCKNKESIYDGAYAIIKFDNNYSYKIIKVVSENVYLSSIGEYGEWIKLQKEFGEKNYPSRNFMRTSTVKFSQFKVLKTDNFGWSEVYFNPFLLGLNEEKPYQDNWIFFGLYKSKPVLFFTNEYLRFRLKLKENQGMATDFDGKEYFVSFKDITNQIVLHGKTDDSKDMYIDTKVRSVSDTEYHFSSPFIDDADNGNYFVISEEVTVNFSDQRETDFKAIWINSQPEVTEKVINDYKQYLIDKPKLKNLVSFRYKD